MAWDSSRPVPWRRLAREWLLYVAIMAGVFLVFFRDRPLFGIFVGLLASGPLYLGLGYILAKFGYQRRSLRELRAAQEDAGEQPAEQPGPKPKAAPTKRTGGQAGRPGGPRKRRR